MIQYYVTFVLIYIISGDLFRLVDQYTVLPPSKQISCRLRFINLLYCFTVIPLSIIVIDDNDSITSDLLFGSSELTTLIMNIAIGYYIFDLLMCLVHYKESGGLFCLVHAFCCLGVYMNSIVLDDGDKPFLHYLGVQCLMFNTSTIFLHLHWFIKYTNIGDERFRYMLTMINDFFGVITFVYYRMINGAWISYVMFSLFYNHYDKVNIGQILFYSMSNILLTLLNYVWFYKNLKKVFYC